MNILAIDTSAKSASVAILSDEKLVVEFFMNTKTTHSQTLMPMLEKALEFSNFKIDDIDCFAISAGPGSFTGLRIGIAAIKGLAYALNKPCVSVSTLEALAYNLISVDGVICAAMDARCNQVYTATFSGNDNQILRLTDDQAIKIDDLGQQLKKLNQKVFFVGDGASLCFKKLSTEIDCRLANETRLFERASSVAFVALEKIKRNETISADDLMPIYLRLPQAQRELEAKNTATQSGL